MVSIIWRRRQGPFGWRIHLTGARVQTASGSAHALDVAGLRSPKIALWTLLPLQRS